MKKIYHNSVGESKYTGLLLVMPFIVGFILFGIYPFVMSLILSFTDSSLSGSVHFTGIENFKRLFSDSDFHKSVAVTLKYILMLVPLKLAVSLGTALLLNMNIKGMGFFRTIYYLPSILGSNIAIAIMWSFLFTSDGLVNQVLEKFGIMSVSWYGEGTPAMFMIVLLRVWEFGSTMIIFLSALNDIPHELYDSARVDGAGKFCIFFRITLPMLKDVIFFNVVMQSITAFQEFNAPFMITGGNPMKSTYTVSMLIYDEAFKHYDTGYANAVSWVLFTMTAIFVSVLFIIKKRLRSDEV